MTYSAEPAKTFGPIQKCKYCTIEKGQMFITISMTPMKIVLSILLPFLHTLFLTAEKP